MSEDGNVLESDNNPASDRPHYDAFVSYATYPDRDLVRDVVDYIEGLHNDLLMPEKFRVPLKLCLDGRNFIFPKAKRERGPNGEETIRTVVCAYQADTRCLVVFSGEKSLTHPWINKEIEWWCERYGVEKVYFALTHGDMPVDEQRRPILKAVMPAELVKRGGASNDVLFDHRCCHEQRRSLLSISERPQRRTSRTSAERQL